MKLLLNFNSFAVWDCQNGFYTFLAPFAVDSDGSGPSHGDKYHQSETSLRFDGKPLNADEDLYVVLPPALIKAVGPIVLGCQAFAINLATGALSRAVVGDVSNDAPDRKLGEGSIALAKAIGVNPDPTTGGDEKWSYRFYFEPGVPARIGSKLYQLQAFGS